MKTIFTLILILTITAGSFAQPKNPAVSKSEYTSISENKVFSISKIYPNPVKDIVNIDVKASTSCRLRISLFNILGVEVKTWEPVDIPSSGQLINFDLSSFKSGVYILKFTDGSHVFSQVIKKS